jgi:adenosylcobinamide-GDP ribazoletransferase
MTRELRLVFTALMFYTRLPVPKYIDHSKEYLQAATKYFPLVGCIVGGLSAAVFWLTVHILPQEVAIVLSMVSTLLITGALHEDGLADVCDGFGGGWTRQKILDIMKDSRSGAFGIIGIVVSLLLKTVLLIKFPIAGIPALLIPAHALSRWCCTLVISFGTYARVDDLSKIKPVAQKMKMSQWLMALLFGWIPLLLFKSLLVLFCIPVLGITTFLLYRYFKKWIGGYTGDCLGAVQQITEIGFYILLSALWKFTL